MKIATTRKLFASCEITSWGRVKHSLSIQSIAMVFACAIGFLLNFGYSNAAAETRSLKLYYLHTGEKDTIAYKRNGKYLKSGLTKINRFLRDWRRNEPTKMDPRLLDLVWEVYKQTGSRDYIHVISGYRSPKTNNMLRKRGRGVASKSQHTLGKALDFYLPDVKLSKLRKIGLIKQVGGVGYYPKSGSPFVHLDTGSVRHWPRMSRTELARVFPDGKTLHVPSDGKPLKGYQIAKARYSKKKRNLGKIVVSNEKELPKNPKTNKPNFFQRLVGKDEEEDLESVTTPAPTPVKTTKNPAPAIKPEEPVEESPEETPAEIVVASLPESVPVPSIAPRRSVVEDKPVVAGVSDVVAETREFIADTTITEVEQPVTASLANTTEPLDQDTNFEAQTVLASVVPQQRPAAVLSQTGELALVDNTSQISGSPAEVIDVPVLRETISGDGGTTGERANMKLAALSPSEIQDLRSQFRQKSGALVKSPAPRPRPSVNIPQASDHVVRVANFDRFAPISKNADIRTVRLEQELARKRSRAKPVPIAERMIDVASLAPVGNETVTRSISVAQPTAPRKNPLKTGAEAVAEDKTIDGTIETASLSPIEAMATEPSLVTSLLPVEPELKATGDTGLPTSNPIRKALEEAPAQEVDTNLKVASLSPIEPGTISTNQIGLPSSNPEREAKRIEILNELAERARAEQVASENDSLQVASLPGTGAIIVPTPRPVNAESGITLAMLDNGEQIMIVDDEAGETETSGLRSLKTSLSQFDIPESARNGIGRFALASNQTIREISEIRSPAYGRNAILELPSTVLMLGFQPDLDVWSTDRFTGKAVQTVAFAKFQK